MKYRVPANAEDDFLSDEEVEELFRDSVPGDTVHYFLTYEVKEVLFRYRVPALADDYFLTDEEVEELFHYSFPFDADDDSVFLEDFVDTDFGYILDELL